MEAGACGEQANLVVVMIMRFHRLVGDERLHSHRPTRRKLHRMLTDSKKWIHGIGPESFKYSSGTFKTIYARSATICPMITAQSTSFDVADVTAAHVNEYRRNGFIQINDVFVGEELQALRDAVATAVESESEEQRDPNRPLTTYETIFVQKVNLWRRHPEVAKFVTSKRLGNLAAKLEGMPMRVWHDQALFKEPGKGNNKTPWHQDAVYWPHVDRWRQTTIWIALKDATIHNGCMSFVGGTHALGTVPAIDLSNPQDIFAYAPHIKPAKPVTCELRAGSVTFHNGLTFHYAGPNKSEGLREAFAIIYMPDGTTFDGTRHVVTEPLNLKPGDKLVGEMFPLVSDR